MLNSIISIFKGDPVYWLGDQKIVIFSLAAAMIWQAIGIIWLCIWQVWRAFQSASMRVPHWTGRQKQQFFQITLPMIWTNIRINTDILYHKQYQSEFPFCKGDDKRRT